MKKLLYVIPLLFILFSCERRPLCYNEIQSAELFIEIDWSESFPENKPTGVSVWLYPQDGGEPIQSYSANVDRHAVTVEMGSYDIVVFNLTPYELSSTIGFRGEDKFDTLEVFSKPITTSREPTQSRGVLTYEPEMFAAGLYLDLDVTEEMVEETTMSKQGTSKSTITRTIKVTPQLATQRHAVSVEVKGFKNLSNNGVFGELSGLAEGYFIGSGKANSINSRQQLIGWEQTEIFGATKDRGEAYVTYTTWGLTAEETKTTDYTYWTGLLELLIRLVDGTDREFAVDLDHRNIKSNSSTTQTDIELLIEIGFDSGDTPIILPDVIPSGDDQTGFDPEVNPWEEEDVPVVVG